MRWRRTAGLCAAAAVTVGLTACGGSSSGPPAQGAGPDLGTPINLADCMDWKDASVEQRLGTIREIRNFSGGPVAGTGSGQGAVLEDDKAYDLFDNACSHEYARAFKLYKLYGRAAAFTSP